MAYMNDPLQKKNQEDQTQNQNQNSGGNIYSTSSSEVSSQVDQKSSPSGNSNNSNTSSNSSGNWVNLNSYLDANQDKAGRYATTLVENDLNKGQDYKNNLQNAKDNYISSITSDDAYKYSGGNDNTLLKQFISDSSKVSDGDRTRLKDVLIGYQGDDYIQNTGDKYGYNDLKQESDSFAKLSKINTNDNLLKSKMGNSVSSGGKNLNNFIIRASDDSKNILNDASSNFSKLASLLGDTETELADTRDNVVNVANTNSEKARNVVRDAADDAKAKLQYLYNQAEAINAATIGKYKGDYGNLSSRPSGTTSEGGYVSYYQDTTGDAKAQLEKEKQEIENRSNYLLGNGNLEGDSKIDSDFQFTNWVAPSEQQKQVQTELSNTFDNEITNSQAIQSLVSENPGIADTILALKLSVMSGEINLDQAKEYLKRIPGYLEARYPYLIGNIKLS